jgi:hypothetical protein
LSGLIYRRYLNHITTEALLLDKKTDYQILWPTSIALEYRYRYLKLQKHFDMLQFFNIGQYFR